MALPCCGCTSHEDHTQFPFPGAVCGGITHQKKVSVLAAPVLLPGSAEVSPNVFPGVAQQVLSVGLLCKSTLIILALAGLDM